MDYSAIDVYRDNIRDFGLNFTLSRISCEEILFAFTHFADSIRKQIEQGDDGKAKSKGQRCHKCSIA